MQNLPIYFLVEWCLWAPCLLCIRNNTDSCHSEWTNVVSTIYICRIEENRIFRIRNEWNNSVFKNRPSAYQKCRWIVPDYEKQLYLHNVLSTCQMAKKKHGYSHRKQNLWDEFWWCISVLLWLLTCHPVSTASPLCPDWRMCAWGRYHRPVVSWTAPYGLTRTMRPAARVANHHHYWCHDSSI